MNLHLTDLVVDEPPYLLDPDAAVRSGKRRRRQRQAALLGATAVTLGVVGAGALLVGGGSPHPDTVSFAATPTASASSAEVSDGSSYYRIARAPTPDGWTITHSAQEESGWYANVDDGQGAGRLGLWLGTGGLQQHPCGDSEFVAKADSCVETMIGPDARLIVRSVSKTNPVNDVEVVIVHGDGSGVNVEADNATWPDPPPSGTRMTAEQKQAFSHGTIGHEVPAYSTDQLVAMAEELDATR